MSIEVRSFLDYVAEQFSEYGKFSFETIEEFVTFCEYEYEQMSIYFEQYEKEKGIDISEYFEEY